MKRHIRRFKYRIYPTEEQEKFIKQHFAATRVVYNRLFKQLEYDILDNNSFWNAIYNIADFKRREGYTWLQTVDSSVFYETIFDLFQNLRKYRKDPYRRKRLHSKNDMFQSYRIRCKGKGIRIVNNGKSLIIPKLKSAIKIKQSRTFEGTILTVAIIRKPDGKYFASFCVEEDVKLPNKRSTGGEVGIDVGLKSFYTDDKGNKSESPIKDEKLKKKIDKAWKKYYKTEEGSNRSKKARLRIAKLYERESETQADFVHKETKRLVEENKLIAVEDLDIQDMIKNKRLRRNIIRAKWSMFFMLLGYKAERIGTNLVKVPRKFPSSQLCSVCGYRNKEVKNLDIREWDCPKCGTHHDRDRNAAINILNKAKEILDKQSDEEMLKFLFE